MYGPIDHLPFIVFHYPPAYHLLKAGAMTRQASTELLAQFLDPRTVAGLTLYVAAAFLYIIALRRIPLSVRCPARPPLILARYLSVISYTTRQ
jgi:hypothetical protein